jgi:hypothetical protein
MGGGGKGSIFSCSCIICPCPHNVSSANFPPAAKKGRWGNRLKEEPVADRLTPLVLAALGRATAEPAGLPLHGSRSAPGLFPGTALGKQAAQRCKEEGYLQALPSGERYALTDKGLAYLLSQSSPRQVLEDLVRALEQRQSQAAELLGAAQCMRETLDGLKTTAEKVLRAVPPPASAAEGDAGKEAVLALLARRQAAQTDGDCPLPELYRQARQTAPALTIGGFHDALRQLHDAARIELHPWTGPLYAIPEPPYALLIGHTIAYYASPRRLAG